jgi:cell division protease FtsH
MIKTIRDQNSYTSKKQDENTDTGKSFKDVGGCDKAKKAIYDILDYLKRPEHYEKYGITMPKGLLLHGPPGTGKTLVAKAAASEAKIPVIYASGSEFVELYVGMGAKRIRELFK